MSPIQRLADSQTGGRIHVPFVLCLCLRFNLPQGERCIRIVGKAPDNNAPSESCGQLLAAPCLCAGAVVTDEVPSFVLVCFRPTLPSKTALVALHWFLFDELSHHQPPSDTLRGIQCTWTNGHVVSMSSGENTALLHLIVVQG